jgi:hypothetical protein
LLEAEIDVARLVWVEHGSGPRASAEVERLACTQVDVARLIRIEDRTGRGKHFLGMTDGSSDAWKACEACKHDNDQEPPNRRQPTLTRRCEVWVA